MCICTTLVVVMIEIVSAMLIGTTLTAFSTGKVLSSSSSCLSSYMSITVKTTTTVVMLVSAASDLVLFKLKTGQPLLMLLMLQLGLRIPSLKTSECITTPAVFFQLNGQTNTVVVGTLKLVARLSCSMPVRIL